MNGIRAAGPTFAGVVALGLILLALAPQPSGAPDAVAQNGEHRLYVPGLVRSSSAPPAQAPTQTPTPPGTDDCSADQAYRIAFLAEYDPYIDAWEHFDSLYDSPNMASAVWRQDVVTTSQEIIERGERFRALTAASIWLPFDTVLNYALDEYEDAMLAAIASIDVRDAAAFLASYELIDAGDDYWFSLSPLIPETPCRTPQAGLTPTPLPEVSATVTSSPTSTPTAGGPWYTSAHPSAEYYYCEADAGWRNLSPTYLREYETEADLLTEWAGQRTKHPESKC